LPFCRDLYKMRSPRSLELNNRLETVCQMYV